MLCVPLAAVIIINAHPPEVGLSEKDAYFHLVELRTAVDDTPLRGKAPPTAGFDFVVAQKEDAHFGLFALLQAVEQGRYARKRKEIPRAVFSVLASQDCPRWRFVPWAEKYALLEGNAANAGETTQQNAVRLLGQIGNAEHVEKLAPLLDHPQWAPRLLAIEAITQLGDLRHANLIFDKQFSPKRFTGRLGEVEKDAVTQAYKTLLAKAPPATDKNPSKK